MCLVIPTTSSAWLKIHHPECNTPHLVNPSRTTDCHDTHPDSVNYDNINYSTSSPSSPDSNKELTVQGLSNCCQNSLSLILTKKSKLNSFLKVPTPLAHTSKAKTRGAKVLTSQEYLEELEEKERLKKEKEEQKEQKRIQREGKAKLKACGAF